MKKIVPCILLAFLAIEFCFSQLYKDSKATVDGRVEELLMQMTLAEKIGQMTQAERGSVSSNTDITTYFLGSVLSGGGSAPANNTAEGWADMYDQLQAKALATRLGIPMIYGVDAVHGNNNLFGAVIFPHNIGMGCTHDPELVKMAAHITATEMSATGVDWTFSPCLAVPRDERWGRTYEGFGEDPDLVSIMAAAAIEGFQGDTLADSLSVLACAKHYLGDGGTNLGINTGNMQVDEATLRAIHLPGYIAAVNSHVATVMASYSSWNGVRMHGNKYLITDVLKGELGFEGFVVSDWNGISTLPGTRREQIKAAVDAGIDMAMEPTSYTSFISTLTDLVNTGEIPQERIDDAVRRILHVKFEMGLFEHPYSNRSLIDSVGTAYHRNIARQCVRESLVVVKKRDDVLPLAKENLKIHVAGSNANNIGNQCGGWTLSWQGFSGNYIPGTSIYNGLQQLASGNTFTYSLNASGGSTADIGIVVIGETPYAESPGDRNSIDGLITSQDIQAVKTMKSYGIPVIVILVTGRPVNIQPVYHYADAIIAAWLPGTEGQGVADVLFGNYAPTGRLSHSWPVNNAQLPINIGDEEYEPFYPFDFGITSFDNSLPGAEPQFYSAAVGSTGDYIELSFDKRMALPLGDEDHFAVTVDGSLCGVQSVAYAPGDSFRVRLIVDQLIRKNETVYLDYTPGNFSSVDGAVAGEISGYPVRNYSELEGSSVGGLTASGVFAYPNPAGDLFYLHLSGFDRLNTRLELYNTAGQRIRSMAEQGADDDLLLIKTIGIPAGIYFIRISDSAHSKTLRIQIRD